MVTEQNLTIRIIDTPRNSLKFFILNTPIFLKDFLLLKLYLENSFTLDNVANDILKVILNKNNLTSELRKLQYKIKGIYGKTYIEESYKEIIDQLMNFLRSIMKDLDTFEIYKDKVLPFNTLWLEEPDTFILFKMEVKDVF